MLTKEKDFMQKLKKKEGDNLIPRGVYCYDEVGVCPYWDSDKDKPYQYNGYCWFLEKGDWDLNKEKKWTNTQTGEIETGDEIGLPMSLLWDQCKECGIDDDIDEDDLN